MKIDSNKPKINENVDVADLVKMQAEYALAESMSKSKTLLFMTLVGVLITTGLFWFLFEVVG